MNLNVTLWRGVIGDWNTVGDQGPEEGNFSNEPFLF